MATATRTQCRYDHRPRNLIRTTRDIHCAIERGFPRSTARGRLTDSEVPVVTVEALNLEATQLQREVLRLQRVGFTGAQHDDHTAVRRRLDGPAVVDRITHVVVGEDVFFKTARGCEQLLSGRRAGKEAACIRDVRNAARHTGRRSQVAIIKRFLRLPFAAAAPTSS